MKTLLISAAIFCAYWIVSINDENAKLKEVITGDTWCEIKYQHSTEWKQCRVLTKAESSKQVATIQY